MRSEVKYIITLKARRFDELRRQFVSVRNKGVGEPRRVVSGSCRVAGMALTPDRIPRWLPYCKRKVMENGSNYAVRLACFPKAQNHIRFCAECGEQVSVVNKAEDSRPGRAVAISPVNT